MLCVASHILNRFAGNEKAGFMDRLRKLFLLIAALAAGGIAPASAQNVQIAVDTSLADYILEFTCSGEEIDETRLRSSRLLQAQIKHHSGNSDQFTMDGFIDAAKAAASCEVLERDLYRFRYVVEDREQIARAIDFLKEREAELSAFVVEKIAPYFPPDNQFSGEIVLAAASWSCGGFSMDGAFFVDVPCVAPSIEDEFHAVKILSAHETYHALQYAFFAPFNEDMSAVDTPEAAQAYLFLSLLLEGTAEFVADSRDVTGEGTLATIFRDLARQGYGRLASHFRWLDYASTVLAVDETSNRRIRDIYDFGFSGSTGQKFYYVGASMARKIEAVFGRDRLVCVISLSPEQFVLAYDAALEQAGEDSDHPVGPSTLAAALRLGQKNPSFRNCFGE
jgi:hypothetical protein